MVKYYPFCGLKTFPLVFNLVKNISLANSTFFSFKGMFVVSLPFAVKSGGYWALLSMILVAYICSYTGKILVDCLYDECDDQIAYIKPKFLKLKTSYSCRRTRVRTSYVDIAADVWGGRIGAGLVNVAQNIELLMTCILYLVLCGDLFVGSFPNMGLDHSSWTILSCMILVPCAFIKSLKFVSSLSLCNAVVHIVINLIIVVYCLTKVFDWDFGKIDVRLNVCSFPISLGIIVFGYTSQIFLPSMEGNMIDKSKFDPMLYVTHFVAAAFKCLFGLVGFLTWQENTKEVITNNLPTQQLKIIVNVILIIKALLSYPLPYYASVELLEASLFLKDDENLSSHHAAKSRPPLFAYSCYLADGDLKFWAVLLRIGLILFTLFLAIFIPHFAYLMALIGSITGTMLSLIWPCYFHLHLKRRTLVWHQKLTNVAIIVFGLVITVTGVYNSSNELAKALGRDLAEAGFLNTEWFLKKV
ncbi:Vesicular inhibitory amino acid transporter [Brachionus plicatilis]|uniref:Vesicular inhibitory amino acid transporter n=1 Tax=Brachionus plicatilis TaxID=10195 RepID=A0A3M7S7D6_BRAPC|nr:Vesicular inhibitory amino acid transporter [Brachionus plicatilis]